MTEDFNFQQHLCENLKSRTTLSQLNLTDFESNYEEASRISVLGTGVQEWTLE
jgi:hypothetical protein